MLCYTATPVSPGIVIGPCRIIVHRTAALRRVLQAPEAEQHLFEAACILAQGELESLSRQADSPQQRDMLAFQHAVLEDVTFLDTVTEAISRGRGALGAVQEALAYFTATMRQLDDAYFRARSADIEDVGHRLCDILAGQSHDHLVLSEPTILAAQDLYPSDLVSVDRHLVLGIAVAEGSPQSHAAIIARTLGIPAVVLAGGAFLEHAAGAEMALDGGRGEFFLAPDEAVRARFHHQMQLARRRRLYLETLRTAPCLTKDGVRVTLLANCSNPEDIAAALAAGAEGVGLLRSEFLFIENHLPDEAEQLAFYRRCLEAARGLPLTIRTIDVGADKRVAGLSAENESNPALGLRGIRLSLAYENLLTVQFRALLRASADGPLHVLLPMVATVQDLLRAQQVFARAREALRAEGEPFDPQLPLGTMIETPAAAVLSDRLAARCAFFSLGTNDLTQYTHAADRTNPAVAGYYLPDSEAVQRLVGLTLANARRAGIPCSICGESAAVPAIAAQYVRMGARILSMAAPSIAEVKELLCDIDLRTLPPAADPLRFPL